MVPLKYSKGGRSRSGFRRAHGRGGPLGLCGAIGVHRSFIEQEHDEEEVDRTRKSAQSWREGRVRRS